MRKLHFVALGAAVSRVLDALSEWSEPGTQGKLVALDTVEHALLGELGSFVEKQGGSADRWRREVRAVPLTRRLERVKAKAIKMHEWTPASVGCHWSKGVYSISTYIAGDRSDVGYALYREREGEIGRYKTFDEAAENAR